MQKDYENCITTVNKLGNIPTLPVHLNQFTATTSKLPKYVETYSTLKICIFRTSFNHVSYLLPLSTIDASQRSAPSTHFHQCIHLDINKFPHTSSLLSQCGINRK